MTATSTLRPRRATLAAILLTFSHGCAAGALAGPFDGGPDGASALDARVHVVVERARREPSEHGSVLVLSVRLRNGPAGAPAPAGPAAYRIETRAGLVFGAMDEARDEPACNARFYVAARASYACDLFVLLPDGDVPARLTYLAPDARTASAPIESCEATDGEGLCDDSAAPICERGCCRPACAIEPARGACFRADELCVEGACIPRCSPWHRSGACPAGTVCEGGECRAGPPSAAHD